MGVSWLVTPFFAYKIHLSRIPQFGLECFAQGLGTVFPAPIAVASRSRFVLAPRGRRAAELALSGPRSRAALVGSPALLRQRPGLRTHSVATANGACAREFHRPPSRAVWCASQRGGGATSVRESSGRSNRGSPTRNAGWVVWVPGRRGHSRLPQSGRACNGVDAAARASQPKPPASVPRRTGTRTTRPAHQAGTKRQNRQPTRQRGQTL